MTDTANSKSTKRIQISSAPIACPPVTGGSRGRQQPKPTAIPDDLPPYYPAALIPQTNLVICKAVEKFPAQTQILELCKYVITELRPSFAEALRNQVLRPDEASRRMQELIFSLLEYNCDSDSRRDELKNEVRRSEEWLSLTETIDGSQSGGSNPRPSSKRKPSDKSQRLAKAKTSIQLLWEKTPGVTYKDIVVSADNLKIDLPWRNFSSWSDAWAKHESAVKALL